MTAIAGLRFQAVFGERPFTGANRSLDRKSAAGSFGSQAAVDPLMRECRLCAVTGPMADNPSPPLESETA
jgi:hypothetical protein